MVLSGTGGRYRVLAGDDVLVASLRGRMKQTDDRVVVGDCVMVRTHAHGGATIEAVRERRSVLRRRSPGNRHPARAVAANLDQAVVVGAARDPQWDPSLIDRFLAVAEANGLPIVLVINKCDLDPEYAKAAAPYLAVGYSVVFTSVGERLGLEDLRGRLVGRVSAFAGQTGVGKSSLLNALQPGLRLRTASVGRRSGMGRHATVAAEMYPFQPDGFVVDTPGLRDIGLWGLAPHDVARAFPEIAALAAGCRFDNCRHLGEPGCAVEEAATSGRVAASRLSSYRALLQEARHAARPWG